MDEMPSAQFRKRYAAIKEPTVVTVNGHPIGQWIPVGYALTVALNGDAITIDPPPMRGQGVSIQTKYPYEPGSLKVLNTAEADAARTADRFNSRPFTPVPKGRK